MSTNFVTTNADSTLPLVGNKKVTREQNHNAAAEALIDKLFDKPTASLIKSAVTIYQLSDPNYDLTQFLTESVKDKVETFKSQQIHMRRKTSKK